MANKPVALQPAPLAPAINSTTSRELLPKPTACTTCVRRKVKCDRTQPCSTCRNGPFTCEYLEPPLKKRKRKDHEELQDRLDRYEHLLRQNGLLPVSEDQKLPEKHEPPTTVKPTQHQVLNPQETSNDDTSASSRNGTMVSGGPGQTIYIESHLWKDLGDDLHLSSDSEDEQPAMSTPAQEPSTQPSPADLISAGLFGASTPSYNLSGLHPAPSQAMKLWQVYLRNIDPILKIVHGPSMTVLLENLRPDMTSVPKETECLLFAIYHFAITTLTEHEREEMYGHSWLEVQRKYHDAVRQSLLHCSFYRTTSLVVLQAYTLLLVSVRFQYNSHTFWILCGIAIRLAQRMGLNSEDERHLSPFDLEIRRRVWWHLLIMDTFAAQHAGTTVATIPADSWNAPRPLNVDDKDIWPGMTEPPKAKQAATDMIAPLARLELTVYKSKMSRTSGQSPEDLEATVTELEDLIHGRYLRYCDPTEPMHYTIMVGARAAILNARLRTRLIRVKRGIASASEKNEVFTMALKLLDYDAAVMSSPLASRYAWQFRVFFSWEPLIGALQQLCQEQDCSHVRDAWDKIERVFTGHPNLVTPTRPIELAIARLALRAWDLTQHRSAVLKPEPTFLVSLRQYLQRRVETGTPKDKRSTAATSPAEQSATTLAGAQDTFMDESGMWDYLGTDIDWDFWDDLIRNTEFESVLP